MKNLVSPEALKSDKLLRGKLCWKQVPRFRRTSSWFPLAFKSYLVDRHQKKYLLILNYIVHIGFDKACRKTV